MPSIYYQKLLVQIHFTSKMHPISKKNTVPAKKTISSNTRPLKRSKSTEHLLPKKAPKRRVDRDQSEDTFTNSHSLAKSKSAKSVKSKTSTLHRSVVPCKKAPSKKKSQAKTVKKILSRQSNEVSSILTEEWKTVKPSNEYFIYCNNYIAIENSAQRRLVYKIQMIDLQNKSTTDCFPTQQQSRSKETVEVLELKEKDLRDQQMGTDPKDTKEIAIGEILDIDQQETQTSDRKSFEEIAEKCFADVLTELEFLYMPNQNNFEPFNQNERLHYGQMLEALAKKMLSGCKNIVTGNILTEDQITVLIYQREGIQVGALEFVPAEGFPTHLLAVLAYLKNLFCYIDYSFRDEVIANLRQFYGYNYNERVSRLTRRLPHEKDRKNVLSPQIFKTFQHEMFKDYDFPSEVVKESVHIHNRAVFDAVNTELQTFRPFFSSEGEPFPWSINLGMTHYDITEEALYIIFMQIKEKLQKQLVTLCGMHLDFDDKSLPDPGSCKLYKKKMEEKTERMVLQDVKKADDGVELDYEKTALRFQLAEEIFYQLIDELERDLLGLNDDIDVFQYFF